MLLLCVDFNRICDVAAHLGHKFEMSDVTSFITGSTDTVLAAQTAAIAAKSLGIDSLFTNGIHRGDMNCIYEILDLLRCISCNKLPILPTKFMRQGTGGLSHK